MAPFRTRASVPQLRLTPSVLPPAVVATVIWIHARWCTVLQLVEVTNITHAKRIVSRLRATLTRLHTVLVHVLTLVDTVAVARAIVGWPGGLSVDA